jgi:hypothetical protein
MAENSDRRIPGLDDDDSIAGMRRRHIQIAMRMQALGALGLEELEKKAKAGEPLNLTAEDAKTLLDAGAKLERAALGEKEREQDADGSLAPIVNKKPN